jgi:hypothetical protein
VSASDDHTGTLGPALHSSFQSYRNRQVRRRVVADVVACSAGLLAWFFIGGQADWTAPYFGAVMVAWVMSDFASNLLFLPSENVARCVVEDGPIGLTLFAENVALATWLFPFGLVASFIACAALGQMHNVLVAIVAVIAVLGAWMGVGDVVSVTSPRIPLGMKVLSGGPARWRREFRRGVVYFGTMFIVGPLLCLPAAIGFYYALYHRGWSRLAAVAVAIAWSVAVWVYGLRRAVSMTPSRRVNVESVYREYVLQ